MPQVNLTDLTGHELRQRLDSSRSRGDAALALEILREMAARRDSEAARRRPLLKRRASAPHLVSIDLGDPMDKDDELPPLPAWRLPQGEAVAAADAPPPPQREPEPAPARRPPRRKMKPSPGAPSSIAAAIDRIDVEPVAPPVDAEPQPWEDEEADLAPLDLGLRPEAMQSPAPRPRSGLRIAAGFAIGITCGLGLGWWAAGMARDAPPPAPAPVQTASLVRPPAPAPATLAVALAPPAPAQELNPVGEPPTPTEEAAPPTETADLEPESRPVEPAPPIRTAEKAEPDAERPVAVAAGGCAAAPTPADREICGDPALQRLQRELRQAYSEALDAHEDRALLRQRQLAWREARNSVSDPDRLARLYEQRIQKLHAAAAEARAQR